MRVDEQMVVLLPRLDQIPGTVVEQKAALSRARLRVVNGVADGDARPRARAFEDRPSELTALERCVPGNQNTILLIELVP